MAQKYPGLYLYYDWMEGLLQLPPERAMEIIRNLYFFSKDDVEPQPLEDAMCNILQNFIMAGMKRSKQSAENGRMGGIISSVRRGAAAKPSIPEWNPFPPPEAFDDEALDQYIREHHPLLKSKAMQEKHIG